jgi:acyl dehydratase
MHRLMAASEITSKSSSIAHPWFLRGIWKALMTSAKGMVGASTLGIRVLAPLLAGRRVTDTARINSII